MAPLFDAHRAHDTEAFRLRADKAHSPRQKEGFAAVLRHYDLVLDTLGGKRS